MRNKPLLIGLIILLPLVLAAILYVKHILDNSGGRTLTLADNLKVNDVWKSVDLQSFKFYKKANNLIWLESQSPAWLGEKDTTRLPQIEIQDFEGGRCSLEPVVHNPRSSGLYYIGNDSEMCFADARKYKYLWIKSSNDVQVTVAYWGYDEKDIKR